MRSCSSLLHWAADFVADHVVDRLGQLLDLARESAFGDRRAIGNPLARFEDERVLGCVLDHHERLAIDDGARRSTGSGGNFRPRVTGASGPSRGRLLLRNRCFWAMGGDSFVERDKRPGRSRGRVRSRWLHPTTISGEGAAVFCRKHSCHRRDAQHRRPSSSRAA